MKSFVSKITKQLKSSGIREFFDLVLGMKEVISLGVGEPDFVTPWQITEAGIYSLEQGFTSYTSNKGLYKLRLGISKYLYKNYKLDYCPDDEILITVGVSEALDLALRAIINPGDKVIIPIPSYVSYGPVTELAGGRPVYIDTTKTNFKLSPKDLLKNIDSKTKAVILNYPTNPTGVTYTKDELMEFNRIVSKKEILCITDEVYGDLSYDFEHIPFATLKGAKKHTLYLNGFSKSYAMTGWRVGFACGPKDLISAMTKIHQYTIMCVSSTSQWASYEALHSGRKSVDQMKLEYKRRREFVYNVFNSMGLNCVKPQGAFYCFVSIKSTGLSSVEFSKRLLKQYKVAVVPGVAFGDNAEGYIRVSYAENFEKLKEALNRITEFVAKIKNKN